MKELKEYNIQTVARQSKFIPVAPFDNPIQRRKVKHKRNTRQSQKKLISKMVIKYNGNGKDRRGRKNNNREATVA